MFIHAREASRNPNWASQNCHRTMSERTTARMRMVDEQPHIAPSGPTQTKGFSAALRLGPCPWMTWPSLSRRQRSVIDSDELWKYTTSLMNPASSPYQANMPHPCIACHCSLCSARRERCMLEQYRSLATSAQSALLPNPAWELLSSCSCALRHRLIVSHIGSWVGGLSDPLSR